MERYSLYQLNEYIRRVVALNFQNPVWIEAEIASIGQSRGHIYLDLVEKHPDHFDILAKAQAVIWRKQFQELQKIHLFFQDFLQEGTFLPLKVEVNFHERYGLKLIVVDVDPSFAEGALSLKRKKIIQTLKRLNLLGLNSLLPLPKVLQRIAVISSEEAVGYIDLKSHLNQNPFGYDIQTTLFPASVQGMFAEKEILRKLKEIQNTSDRFDCVTIVRGGGAKLDLLAFDSLEIAKAVAQFPLPVISGIGHDVDQSVLDQTAHSALKTPTAVADFIIQHNFNFESKLLQMEAYLNNLTSHIIKKEEQLLQNLDRRLPLIASQGTQNQRRKIDRLENQMKLHLKLKLQQARFKLEELDRLHQLLDPQQLLKRGYSITTKENGTILSKNNLPLPGEQLRTMFDGGNLWSKVENLETNE